MGSVLVEPQKAQCDEGSAHAHRDSAGMRDVEDLFARNSMLVAFSIDQPYLVE